MTKKTIKHASADVGLIFTAYNLRRIFNLIDTNVLKQYLNTLSLLLWTIKSIFKAFLASFVFEIDKPITQKKFLNVA